MTPERHKFFELFPEPQRAALLAATEVETYDTDTRLFDEGDAGGTLYLVLDGAVEISGQTSAGDRQSICTLAAHEFFGEFSALDGGPRNARVDVAAGTALAAIPRPAFLQALDESPVDSTQSLMSAMIERIREFHSRFFTDVVRSQRLMLLGELTKSIVHDLRSPMSILRGTADMLQQRHADDEETQRWCESMKLQAQRVHDMAQDVLEFARGDTQLRLREVELQTVLQYFEHMNGDYLRRQGIELSIDTAPVTLTADPDKLTRVLQNLVNNAAEALDGSGHIDIAARADGEQVVIEIRDDGPGIPEDLRERLFEPFSTGRDDYGGTGLGAGIARNLVLAHGGSIDFTTGPSGTTFTIRLPRSAATAGQRPSA